jgi:hypothetical protein
MEKFIRVDIVADLACSYRRLKKGAHGGSNSLFEVCAQRFEGRISWVQGWGEPAFGRNKGGVSLHPPGKSRAGRKLGSKDWCGFRAGVDFVTEDGRNEVRALRKMTIKGADADVCFLCNLSHRSVHSRAGEHCLRRLKYRGEVALWVRAYASVYSAIAPWLDSTIGVFGFIAHSPSQLTVGTMFRINTECCSGWYTLT